MSINVLVEHKAIGSYIVALLEFPMPVMHGCRFMVQVVTFNKSGKPVAIKVTLEPSKDYGYETFNRTCEELERGGIK